MKKLLVLLSCLLILGLALAACAQAEEPGEATPGDLPALEETEPGELPPMEPTQPAVAPGVTETVVTPETEEPLPETGAELTETPPERGLPGPGLRGAQVVPEHERVEATRLSPLLDFQVVDRNGESLGRVDDYVLNMCEAHIIYMVVEGEQPAAAETATPQAGGGRFLIPYEVVTLLSGVIDVEQNAIVLNLDAGEVAGSPALDGDLDMQDVAWETDVRSFWSDFVTLSDLTTACRVPAQAGVEQPAGTATPQTEGERVSITRISLASQTLGAQVVDGNGEPVGQVEEIILEPESGLLRFVAVRLDEAQEGNRGVVLVPIGALNVRHEEQDGEMSTVLVLLVERGVLNNAPTFGAVPAPEDASWEQPVFQYWSQFVPMTREELQE